MPLLAGIQVLRSKPNISREHHVGLAFHLERMLVLLCVCVCVHHSLQIPPPPTFLLLQKVPSPIKYTHPPPFPPLSLSPSPLPHPPIPLTGNKAKLSPSSPHGLWGEKPRFRPQKFHSLFASVCKSIWGKRKNKKNLFATYHINVILHHGKDMSWARLYATHTKGGEEEALPNERILS